MTERWLAATWPFVRERLPEPPARVLEIGCGPEGGFVPALALAGYHATGVDPKAPEGPEYRQTRFEDVPLQRVDAVVACTSLHHVENLNEVLDRVKASLVTGGVMVVVEFAWERFSEETARWCFDRLPAEPNWLHGHRDNFRDSGGTWDEFLSDWAKAEGLHSGRDMIRELDARFERRLGVVGGPYFFSDLLVGAGAEQRAIEAGLITGTGIRYVGCKPEDSGV